MKAVKAGGRSAGPPQTSTAPSWGSAVCEATSVGAMFMLVRRCRPSSWFPASSSHCRSRRWFRC
ncbi:MAG TPA: hypothetical protein DCP03_04285 [Polaromonas sp.]|nr:hypothetical protein [Polaromonas sp.]